MRPRWTREQGFTLIEVLAAITILSIVTLAFTSYFTNSLSYSKQNQNKTVMINLARNALVYVEKQNFDQMKDYFCVGETEGGIFKAADCDAPSIKSDDCTIDECGYYSPLVDDTEVLARVLKPMVNGVTYNIKIEFQKDLYETNNSTKRKLSPYLLPVKVTVRADDSLTSTNHRGDAVVEGYITDEAIR